MKELSDEYFVQTFIHKGRRERLLSELNHPKKRYRALDRFCHQAEELLDPAKILCRGKKITEEAVFTRLKQQPCRILSPDGFLNERYETFEEAFRLVSMGTDAAIILLDGYAVVTEEAMKGERGMYLMKE